MEAASGEYCAVGRPAKKAAGRTFAPALDCSFDAVKPGIAPAG
jgi:hypothetical protein